VREETLPGTYRLQACADGGKDVTETNEDDNCFTSSGTIQVTGKPDLIVTSVSVRNAPVTVPRGGAVTITADLRRLLPGRRALPGAVLPRGNPRERDQLHRDVLLGWPHAQGLERLGQ
jgi:hypothetical protein